MRITDLKQTVIVPFDFSELSCDALKHATEMLGDPDLIKVIHVTEYPTAYEYGVVWETMTEDAITNRLHESFAERLQEVGLATDFDFSVRFGNPGHQICRFAKEIEAGLLIMPSHGRSGFSRFLLGSVAERVVRMAPCPVLILRDDSSAEDEDEG